MVTRLQNLNIPLFLGKRRRKQVFDFCKGNPSKDMKHQYGMDISHFHSDHIISSRSSFPFHSAAIGDVKKIEPSMKSM